MRWPWARGEAPDRPVERRRAAIDANDRLDLDALEVIELDAAGRLVGPPGQPPDHGLRELADHPTCRDPTGLAGIWEALAQS